MKKKPKIAILGMGKLGLTQAGHMALEGYDISVWNRSQDKLAPLIANDSCIDVSGIVSGKGRLSLITGDCRTAIEDREVIIIATPAFGHYPIINQLLPFLQATQQIILHPGYMMGAVAVHQLLDRHGLGQVLVSELSNALYCVTKAQGASTDILALKEKVGFASLPIAKRDQCLEPLQGLYANCIEPYDSVIETGMLNLNFMQHPFITMMNTGSIDRGEPFSYYHGGATQTVANLIEAADEERVSVCKALGIRSFSAKDLMVRHYPSYISKKDNFYEAIMTNKAYTGFQSPKELYTRHVSEDIPYGIMPVTSIARFLGIKTPALNAICDLCRAVFGKDWTDEARTLETLGLIDMTREKLLAYMQNGHQVAQI